MKKAGFTLIELIFVIVILGILAAVAIPKFAATRDDAKLSIAATDVATLISDFGSYYTSQGQYKGADITDITNVKFNVKTTDIKTDGKGKYQYKIKGNPNNANCFEIITTNEGELQIADTPYQKDESTLCSNLLDKILEKNHATKTYKFGGTSVKL